MRKKNYKGRCEKQALEKFTTICKTYDPIGRVPQRCLYRIIKDNLQPLWEETRGRAAEKKGDKKEVVGECGKLPF